jgi:serine/threonine protein phosphatase PrpC
LDFPCPFAIYVVVFLFVDTVCNKRNICRDNSGGYSFRGNRALMKTASLSDKGKRRQLNQDVVYSSELPVGNLPNLFMIADGMGGHKAGDYASRYAVDTICREAEQSAERNPERILQSAINKANTGIFELSNENRDLEGMGTTVVVATIYGNCLKVGNVGDSRLYIVNGKNIRQITTDHSLVEEMIKMGGLDRESARTHPNKNIITRAVGVTYAVLADFYEVELQKGDIILLCSDGLSNMLEDEEIRMIVNAQRDIMEKAEALVRVANLNGGRDNISLILIEPDI